jgi:mannose-6-phosphate isomerase-like protein (cupin superfamily)
MKSVVINLVCVLVGAGAAAAWFSGALEQSEAALVEAEYALQNQEGDDDFAAALAAAGVTREASIRSAETATVRSNAPQTAQVVMLGDGLEAFVGLLSMDSAANVPEHRDASEEFVYVIEGSGTIHINGVATDIGPGTAVYMPANSLVKYENGAEPLVALQVFAGPESAEKYQQWDVVQP